MGEGGSSTRRVRGCLDRSCTRGPGQMLCRTCRQWRPEQPREFSQSPVAHSVPLVLTLQTKGIRLRQVCCVRCEFASDNRPADAETVPVVNSLHVVSCEAGCKQAVLHVVHQHYTPAAISLPSYRTMHPGGNSYNCFANHVLYILSRDGWNLCVFLSDHARQGKLSTFLEVTFCILCAVIAAVSEYSLSCSTEVPVLYCTVARTAQRQLHGAGNSCVGGARVLCNAHTEDRQM